MPIRDIIPGMVYNTSVGRVWLERIEVDDAMPTIEDWWVWEGPAHWLPIEDVPFHECTPATQEASWKDARYRTE